MKPCVKCGSKEFRVQAWYQATDLIQISGDDGEDFEVIDTEYFSGEWDDKSTVECCECGHDFAYEDWDNQ